MIVVNQLTKEEMIRMLQVCSSYSQAVKDIPIDRRNRTVREYMKEHPEVKLNVDEDVQADENEKIVTCSVIFNVLASPLEEYLEEAGKAYHLSPLLFTFFIDPHVDDMTSATMTLANLKDILIQGKSGTVPAKDGDPAADERVKQIVDFLFTDLPKKRRRLHVKKAFLALLLIAATVLIGAWTLYTVSHLPFWMIPIYN